MTTLETLKEGQRAQIVAVTGDDGISIRLMEMGLTDGEQIELVGFAPLGDPIEFLVRGYRISLRCSEAQRVRVEPLEIRGQPAEGRRQSERIGPEEMPCP